MLTAQSPASSLCDPTRPGEDGGQESHVAGASARKGCSPTRVARPRPRAAGGVGLGVWAQVLSSRAEVLREPRRQSAPSSSGTWPCSPALPQLRLPRGWLVLTGLLSATGPPQRSSSPGRLGLPPVSTPKSQVTGQEVHGALPDGEPGRPRSEAWRRCSCCFCPLGSSLLLPVPPRWRPFCARAPRLCVGSRCRVSAPSLGCVGILSSEVPAEAATWPERRNSGSGESGPQDEPPFFLFWVFVSVTFWSREPPFCWALVLFVGSPRRGPSLRSRAWGP